MKQTYDKNKEKQQLGDLSFFTIFLDKISHYVWQTTRRIATGIWGVKGFLVTIPENLCINTI